MELNFGYVTSYIICRLWAKIYKKLQNRSFYMIYLAFMIFLP
jgi:hypothetical protein